MQSSDIYWDQREKQMWNNNNNNNDDDDDDDTLQLFDDKSHSRNKRQKS